MTALTWAAVVLAWAVVIVVVVVAMTTPAAPTSTGAPFCAWCDWRDGDECTHPKSPVAGRECGAVCSGRLPCDVRQVGRR